MLMWQKIKVSARQAAGETRFVFCFVWFHLMRWRVIFWDRDDHKMIISILHRTHEIANELYCHLLLWWMSNVFDCKRKEVMRGERSKGEGEMDLVWSAFESYLHCLIRCLSRSDLLFYLHFWQKWITCFEFGLDLYLRRAKKLIRRYL